MFGLIMLCQIREPCYGISVTDKTDSLKLQSF